MRVKTRLFALLLALMLVLAGCQKNSSTKENESNDNTNDNNTTEDVVSTIIDETEMFTNRDFETEYDTSKSVSIELKGDSVSCKSDAVKISKTTITLSEEGTYIFSGTLDNGMIVVDAEDSDKLQIVLKNASITSSTSAALYILEADKVFVTLENGTDNVLANGGTFTPIDDNNIDGAVFSKQDLTFNGSGKLTVTSPADHGIVCKDDLVFTGGTYTVNSASHGLDANDSVRMTSASMTIASGKDGIHAENTDDTTLGFLYVKDGSLTISAEGDGLSAGNSMQISDGTFNITSGGGSANASKQTSDSWGNFMGGGMGGGRGGNRPSRPGESGTQTQPETDTSTSDTDDSSTSIKAIKSSGDMLIKGGTFTIDSADDSVHSNASITVSGGTFTIASGDDAFHADETLTISDGNMDIIKSYEGLEALHIKVTGGNIKLVASDDGLNAAGGTDASGYGGVRGNEQFGGGRGGMGGGMGGLGGSSSSNGSILIAGGNLYVNASGDGIDANGSLEISGGYTVVVGPTRGDTATLDYDTSATISGGTFIGTGASGMAQTFSDSEQGVVAVSVGNQSAGTKIELKDSKGNTILTHEPELDFAVVILSSPDVQKGETYTITVGASTSSFEAK